MPSLGPVSRADENERETSGGGAQKEENRDPG